MMQKQIILIDKIQLRQPRIPNMQTNIWFSDTRFLEAHDFGSWWVSGLVALSSFLAYFKKDK